MPCGSPASPQDALRRQAQGMSKPHDEVVLSTAVSRGVADPDPAERHRTSLKRGLACAEAQAASRQLLFDEQRALLRALAASRAEAEAADSESSTALRYASLFN